MLLKRKTTRLIKKTGNSKLRSKENNGLTVKQLFIRAIIRPLKILMLSPIALSCAIYVDVVYEYQYLMYTTFTLVFQEQYGFSTKGAGLTFLDIGVGSLLGFFAFDAVSDRILKAKSKPKAESPSETMQPEYRLPPLVVGAFFIPAGLFLYGWSAQYKTPWIVPIIGTALVDIDNIAVFMCITSYIVDAFNIYAASALAAGTLVRSAVGALLPLAGLRMYAALELGWGNSLLGFIAVLCIPVPWVLMKYGQKLRESLNVNRL